MVSPTKRSWPQEPFVKKAKASDDIVNKTGLGLWAALSSLDREAFQDIPVDDWLKIMHQAKQLVESGRHTDYVSRTYKNVIYLLIYHLKDEEPVHDAIRVWIETCIMTAPFHKPYEDLGPLLTPLADRLYIERNPLYRLLTQLASSPSLGELEKLALENKSLAFTALMDKRSYPTTDRIANIAAKRLSYNAIIKVVATTGALSPKIVHQIIKNKSLNFYQRTQIFGLIKPRVAIDYVSPKGRTARDQFVRYNRLECFNELTLIGTEDSNKPDLVSSPELSPVNFSILEPPKNIKKNCGDLAFIRYVYDCVQQDRYALSFRRMRQVKKEGDLMYGFLLLKQVGHIFSVQDQLTVEGVLTKTDFFVPLFSRIFMTEELEGLPLPSFKFVREALESAYDRVILEDETRRVLHAKLLSPEKNVPIVFSTLYKSHARYIIFYNDLFILCDKDGPNPGFTVYSHPKNLSLELLDQLFSSDETNQLSKEAIVARLEVEEKFHLPMSRQKASICTRSSLNMAIYALLCLYHQVDFGNPDIDKIMSASFQYKQWKAFAAVKLVQTVIEEGHLFLEKPSPSRKPLVYSYLHYPFVKLLAKPHKLAPIVPSEKQASVINHLRWLLNNIAFIKTS